ncbi:MAG TPA: class I SAM-dependent methyltransferase [Flavobacterium sp.]
MKDNFSTQSTAYSKYRPHYPDELIDYIMTFVNKTNQALDVATGNGQMASHLSKYFKKVYATDISKNQLNNAVKHENIIYSLNGAEKTNFNDEQFDLITVAQAIHWFDFERFYMEVYRTLKNDGVFAVIGYGLFSSNSHSDKIVAKLYEDVLGSYWHPERRYLDENYTTIPFPFNEFPTNKFTNQLTWSFEQLEGYLDSWSATQHYKDKHGSNPIDYIRAELRESWENNDKQVTIPLLLRIGTKKI